MRVASVFWEPVFWQARVPFVAFVAAPFQALFEPSFLVLELVWALLEEVLLVPLLGFPVLWALPLLEKALLVVVALLF